MKLAICSGPPTTGKTSVLRHSIRKLQDKGERVAFLKIDVQFAEEDELLSAEFGIPPASSTPASSVPTTAA